MLPAGHAFQAEVGASITFVITGGNVRQLIKLLAVILWFHEYFMKVGAIHASLSGTALSPVSMVMMHVWFIGLKGTPEKLQAKTT